MGHKTLGQDTFFLRKTLTSDAANYVSSDIDISPYTDVTHGVVLIVDKAFITFSTDGQGPIIPADIGTDASKSMGAQCTTETKTSLVEMSDNSLFCRTNVYASADNVSGTNLIILLDQFDALNPAEYVGGFIVPTDKIHVGIDCGSAWAGELDVGFLFEVHTEKLSLSRIQELLVSLTAN